MPRQSIRRKGAVLLGVLVLLLWSYTRGSDTFQTPKVAGDEGDLAAAARKLRYPDARIVEKPDGPPSVYVVKLVVTADYKKVCDWYQQQLAGYTLDKELERIDYVAGDLSVSLDNSSQPGGKRRPLSVRLFRDRNHRHAHETLAVVTRSSEEEVTYILLVLVQVQSR